MLGLPGGVQSAGFRCARWYFTNVALKLQLASVQVSETEVFHGKIQGTHDDATPDEIRKVVENTVAQYQLWRFTEKVVEIEVTLAVAEALESEDLLD